jgi:predicted nucleotidyltransferase
LKDLSAGRRDLLQRNLDIIVHSLRENYHPEKIILFGSLASGKVSETSDLDLLIVKKTTKSFYERLREIVTLCDYNVGVDFLVYTPEELEEEARSNLFLKKEILEKGKVIYDAAAREVAIQS